MANKVVIECFLGGTESQDGSAVQQNEEHLCLINLPLVCVFVCDEEARTQAPNHRHT